MHIRHPRVICRLATRFDITKSTLTWATACPGLAFTCSVGVACSDGGGSRRPLRQTAGFRTLPADYGNHNIVTIRIILIQNSNV